MEFILLALLLFLIILFIVWTIHVDKNIEELNNKLDSIVTNMYKKESEEYEPSSQMIAEGDCNGICKECEEKQLCWQYRLNGDNKHE